MFLKDGHTFDNFKVGKKFNQKVCIISDGDLTTDELDSLSFAFYIMNVAMDKFPPKSNFVFIDVYFCTKQSSIFIPEAASDPSIFGGFKQLIIYPIWRWRDLHLPIPAIIFIMLEELCHAAYLIPDGPQMEHMMTKILQLIDSNCTYQEHRIALNKCAEDHELSS